MKLWSELQQHKLRTLEIYSGLKLSIVPLAGEQVQNETKILHLKEMTAPHETALV